MKKILNKRILISLLILFTILFTGIALNLKDTTSAAVTENKGTINVYLIGGQSNAVGYGADTNDVLASQDSRFVTGFDNTIYYGEQERWPGNSDFTDFVPVKFGYGTGNGWLANVEDLRSGAEIGIANALADNGEMNAVIKCAWGATAIYPDSANGTAHSVGTWTPPSYMEANNVSTEVAKFGEMYSWFVETVTTGISKLIEKGYVPVIKGMWWMQGEAEMFSAEMSSQYDELLRALISDVRTDVSAITGQDCSAMPFIFGLPSWNENKAGAPPFEYEVRENMKSVANDSSLLNVDCIDCEGLVQHDMWHFDAVGQKYLGEAFIQKVNSLNEANNNFNESISSFTTPTIRLDVNEGLKFAAKIANYNDANNYDYGMIIVPTDYLVDNDIKGDYVNAFKNKGIDIINLSCLVNHADYDGDGIVEDYIQGSITEIKYNNVNRDFTGIAYIKDVNGNYLYTSSSVCDSIARLASEKLLKVEQTDASYQKYYNIANLGVNQKNGVAEADATKEATFDLVVNNELNVGFGKILVGEKVNLIQSPAMGYAVTYSSSNQDVVVVDQDGNVSGIAQGNAKIIVKCFNQTKEINVTVGPKKVGEVYIDGVRENAYGNFTEEVTLDGDRYYKLSALKNSEGVVIFAQGLFNTDVSVEDSANMSSNTNFEFKLNAGTQSYVMKNGSYAGVSQYVYNVTSQSGKYLHTIEMFISKSQIKNWRDTADVQINYAWKTPTENAAIYDSIADIEYLSNWGNNTDWHSYHSLGAITNGGGFVSEPANLFISTSGLKGIDVNTPFVMDGEISSEENAILGANQISCSGGSETVVKGTVKDGDLYLVITITHGNWSTYYTGGDWYKNDNFEFYLNGNRDVILFINGQACIPVAFDAGYATTTMSGTRQVTVLELYKQGSQDTYKLSLNANGTGFGWNNIAWGTDGTSNVYVSANGVSVSNGSYSINDVMLDGEFTESVWTSTVKTNTISVVANGASITLMGTKNADGVYFGFTVNHTKAPNISTNGSGNWYTYMNVEVHFNSSNDQFLYTCINSSNASSNLYAYCKTVSNGTGYTSNFEIFIPNSAIGITSSTSSVDFTMAGWFESGWAEVLRVNGWNATHKVSANGISVK